MRFFHSLCFAWVGFSIHAKDRQKITTPHFSIGFYPSALNSAQRIANTLETIYEPVSKTLGVYPSPIRLWINNESASFGGYFNAWPRHIYFPILSQSDPYFVGNADWISMLCIHEFRHAVQYSIEYHSTPCWLKPLYFGSTFGTVCGAPRFFKEGDAVGIETALTKSGRGRLPDWEKLYKVNLLERGPLTFDTQLLEAAKYEVPDVYRLGYYFTTHIRRKYGAEAIKAIHQKSIRGIPIFGFYNAIKKVTNKSLLQVYKDMNEELLLGWQRQLEGLKITPATQLTIKKPGDCFDYLSPFIDASGKLMAWKQGIDLRDQLVEISLMAPEASRLNNKSSYTKDKTLFYFIEKLPLPSAAIGQGCAVWLECCNHPWQKNKRIIRLQYYDLKLRKRRTLVSNSRYTALAISPSTDQLVCVESDETDNNSLVIVETKSGKVVKKIDNPDGAYYLTPSWVGPNHLIVVKTKDQKNSIVRIHIATSKEETLLPYSYEHRSYPKIYKDYLLYNSSYNGIDNIYAMHLTTKSCFQVTSRKYGAYLGVVDPVNHQLIFNDYTKNGMDIAVMPFDPLLWTPLEEVADRSVGYYEPLVQQEQNGDILSKVPNHVYPLSKYRVGPDNLAFTGLTAPPSRELTTNFNIELVKLQSLQEDFKATAYLNCGLTSLLNRKCPVDTFGLKIKYATCYPILKMDIKPIKLNHIGWRPGLDLAIKFPYYFTLASSLGKASLQAQVKLERLNKNVIYKSSIYSFKITNSSAKSRRAMYSSWAQMLFIEFKDIGRLSALEQLTLEKLALQPYKNISTFVANFYFPGIGTHHYIILNPVIQRIKAIQTVPGSGEILISKRYKESSSIKKNEFSTTSVWGQTIALTYGLPLAYPSCGLPLIWFLDRIYMEGYYYHSFNSSPISDTIGIKFRFLSRFLANGSFELPLIDVSIDFALFQRKDNNWQFQFKPECALHLLSSK